MSLFMKSPSLSSGLPRPGGSSIPSTKSTISLAGGFSSHFLLMFSRSFRKSLLSMSTVFFIMCSASRAASLSRSLFFLSSSSNLNCAAASAAFTCASILSFSSCCLFPASPFPL
eukprot:UN31952